MAEDGRDMLIRLVGPDGPFPGECMASFASSDPLMSGFSRNFYSDVQDFDFSVGLEDPAKKSKKDQKAKAKLLLASQGGQGGKGERGKPVEQNVDVQLPVEKNSAGFDDFRNGGSKTYPSDLQPFTFNKLFDVASLSIFNACALSQTLDSVTLVKRKAVGQATLLGYMRLHFTNVLITDLDWDEDKVIKEKVKFICRKVRVQYFPELFGGTFDKTLPFKEWSMKNTTQGT